MSLSTIRLICSGIGLTLFFQADKESACRTMVETIVTMQKNYEMRNRRGDYHSTMILDGWVPDISLKRIRAGTWLSLIGVVSIGGMGTLMYNSKVFEHIMYVTQRNFKTKMKEVCQAVVSVKENLQKQIQFTYDNIMARLNQVENKLTNEVSEVKEEMKKSFASIESKLNVATLERKYANEGIHLICEAVCQHKGEGNRLDKLQEFSAIPMAQFIGHEYYNQKGFKHFAF